MQPQIFHKNIKGYDVVLIGNRLVYWEITESDTGKHVCYLGAYQDPIKYIKEHC